MKHQNEQSDERDDDKVPNKIVLVDVVSTCRVLPDWNPEIVPPAQKARASWGAGSHK